MARTTPGPPRVRFYQLGDMPVARALVIIVGKAYGRGMRVCVAAGEQVREVDDLLWLDPPGDFLPHGRFDEKNPQGQPILVSPEPEERNGATVLVAAHGQVVTAPERFDILVDFVGRDPAALASSRIRYQTYRNLGCQMEYWVQGEEGWKLKE